MGVLTPFGGVTLSPADDYAGGIADQAAPGGFVSSPANTQPRGQQPEGDTPPLVSPKGLREWIAKRVIEQDRGYLSPCWLWTKWRTEKGYARAKVPGLGQRLYRVHRVTYEHFIGPISDGLEIDHLCKVKECVNPDHLEPVTLIENMRRRRGQYRKPRTPSTHCIHGHEFTDENTYRQPSGWRNCRACKANRRSAGATHATA